MKSKIIKAIIACVIVGAVSVGGYYGYKTYFAKKPVAASVQYMTVTARKMNLQVSVQGTGAAYAATTKDVMPNNNGTLKDLAVKVGDTVTAGQKLFTADSDDLRKNVASAQNSVNKQSITLTQDQTDADADPNNTAKANKLAMDKLSMADAQTQLNYANQQVNKMTVTAPVGGVVTVVNNINGDTVQQSKAVLTIVDMSSIKVKVQVDELDIEKVKVGQKSEVKFDAIKGKTYEGTVETIAQTGTTSNNVTNYDVVVSVKDPAGIKLGMNANVSILVDSKDNALVIPSEALIERNGNRFVMIPNSDTAATTSNAGNAAQTNRQQNGQNTAGNNAAGSNAQGQQASGQSNAQGQNRQNRSSQSGQSTRGTGNYANYGGQAYSGDFKLVPIKTGIENENYIEITEGLTDGEKLLVQLPQASTTTNTNNRNGFGGNMGGFGGNMGGFGGNAGGNRQQGGGNNNR